MEGSITRPPLNLAPASFQPGDLVQVLSRANPDRRKQRWVYGTVLEHLRPDFEVKVKLASGAIRRYYPEDVQPRS